MANLFRILPCLINGKDLPPELDLAFYRLVHDDLAAFDDETLTAHFEAYGRAEGRLASPAAHRYGFMALVPADGDVLEIGPFTKPCVRGPRVRYFDVLDQAGLRERAALHGQPTETCPAIDFVSPIGDLSVVEGTYDAVVSSHCIEHQPDLVAHLRAVERLLRPGGRYLMMVPDRRYCFDALLPDSTVADVEEAHAEGRRVHAWRSVMEHRALTTHNDTGRHWAGDSADPGAHLRGDREVAARAEYEAAAGAYIDVHAWQFTPRSFKAVMTALADRGLTRLRCVRSYDTVHGCNEFAAVLARGEEPSERSIGS